MAQLFLTDLNVALAHLDPVQIGAHPFDPTFAAGWQDRGRPPSTGGFEPEGVLCHHTASPAGTSDEVDLNVLIAGNGDAPGPISQLYIGRSATLYIVAAGRANHGGGGVIPGEAAKDDMNRRLFGIEVGNDGIGERWSDAVVDVYAATVAALIDWYGWPLEMVLLHATTGPPAGNFKIDPAGPWLMQPDLPGGGAGTWDLDVWRAHVDAYSYHPPPEPGDEEMGMGYVETDDGVKGCFFRHPATGRLVKIWEGHACWSPAEGAAFYAWPRPRVSRDAFDAVDVYQG